MLNSFGKTRLVILLVAVLLSLPGVVKADRLPPIPDPLPPHWGEQPYSCASAFGNCYGRPYREKAIASYFYTGANHGWDINNPETFERAAWAATATETVYELYGHDSMDAMVGLP